MNFSHECGAMGSLYTMWLSELGTFAMFWDLKIYSITESYVLWYDLHGYVCYYSWNLPISSLLLPWLCLHCIMNYPLCMTHDFATANHYDHAWTAKWAPNICKLSMPMFPMQLRCDGRQHDRRGRLYATKVKWKIYLTCFALLDIGFMIVLMWADWYVLIWAFSAVLTEPAGLPFQTSLLLDQNLKNLINYFSAI